MNYLLVLRTVIIHIVHEKEKNIEPKIQRFTRRRSTYPWQQSTEKVEETATGEHLKQTIKLRINLSLNYDWHQFKTRDYSIY